MFMKSYEYTRLLPINEYGQQLESDVKQITKMSINLLNQTNTTNIKFSEATYLGLTYDRTLDDTCTIYHGKEKLKVLYVNDKTRLIQVYLKEI